MNRLEIESFGGVIGEWGRDEHQPREGGVLLGPTKRIEAPARPDDADGLLRPTIDERDPSPRCDAGARVGEGVALGKTDHHESFAHRSGSLPPGRPGAFPAG
jgi:hypothetical protein